ncbi:DUF4124 domain-containing protein [Aquisalimonas sp.]|uniref:DUF4124 domain-containing protein n=1 Tax=Aquisalimonas sp. TaxID=1872621 RepID=UPI0025C6DDCC|nr:DUF4124 domain-containing protein [Aquisalimonas sp.]
MNKLLAAALGALLAAPALADIYTWKDADGQVHFGETPPAGVAAERLDPRPGAASSPGEASTSEAEVESEGNKQADDAQPSATDAAQQDAALAEACDNARQNVDVLSDESVRRVREDGGESRVLEPEEREERLAEAEAFIDAHC